MSALAGRQVSIGVGGGIAAYKVCELVSSLAKANARVRVVMTKAAQQFITPLTLTTLCRHPAYTDELFWQPLHDRPLHIALGEQSELLVVAPLTANTLAKLAGGLADNLLTNLVLASTCPVLLAPAMNTEMWQQEVVQRNCKLLQGNPRYHWVGPGSGVLACDRIGAGRMAEPAEILAQIESLLHTLGRRDLTNKRILISAGSTREFLDPVRFIGNPSTGKMGIALVQAAQHRGAHVTLVHGPMDPGLLALVPAARCRLVASAAEMQQAMLAEFSTTDWTIMAAAVADVKPAERFDTKLPKQMLSQTLALLPVPDILAALGQRKQSHQILIGFAAQTGDIVAPALQKLEAKQLDAIAANPIDQPNSGFGSDFNQAIFLDRQGHQQKIAPCSKLQLAHQLLDFVLSHLPRS